MDGRSEFSFKNVEEYPFVLLAFSRRIGCRQIGGPTSERAKRPVHA